ncbi:MULTISPECIES: hypothetical protein [unclassified Streptomyces]|uniref:hypothetical protein n=1 Tax=unclassified Streptomyces TaxID=2593676 RepID=UPI002E2E1934|nr:hypothetical protein [Streptomyces sp. NBC_00223]
MATVSSQRTHRQVTGSIAKTSRLLVSSTTYSPGRVARSLPYVPCGPSAIDRFPFVLPSKALVPLDICRSSS